LKQTQLNNLESIKRGDSFQGSMAPPAADGMITRIVKIPNHLAGAVIGRQGETIQQMQHRSGANIQVDNNPTDPNAPTRDVTVRGNQQSVEIAEDLIYQLVQEKETGAQGGGGAAGHYSPGDSSGNTTIKLAVPNNKVGLVIGRGGMTVKGIQMKCRCKILIPEGPDADNPQIRTLTINGWSQQDCEIAKQEILNASNPDNSSLPAGYVEKSHTIPNDKVGLVIGKQGVTIKQIQMQTGCRLQIPQEPDPGSSPPTRTISVSGPQHAIDSAIQEIDRLVFRTGAPPLTSTGYGGYEQQAAYSQQYGGYGQTGYAQQQYGYGQQAGYAQQYAGYGQQQQAQPQAQMASAGGIPQQQAGQLPQAQAEGEQKYTKEQWEQWRTYYAQYGYDMPAECPEHLRADNFG